jgi:predicted RNase H-like HicB family nuclease
MLQIESYMQDHFDEGYIVRLAVEMDTVGDFVASIVDEKGNTLLDRQGDLYMTATADTLEDALAELDEMAGKADR